MDTGHGVQGRGRALMGIWAGHTGQGESWKVSGLSRWDRQMRGGLWGQKHGRGESQGHLWEINIPTVGRVRLQWGQQQNHSPSQVLLAPDGPEGEGVGRGWGPRGQLSQPRLSAWTSRGWGQQPEHGCQPQSQPSKAPGRM